MFINYFKIAIRNILRHRVYTFINVAGLSIGMTCSILIFLFVQDELRFDKFHVNADRICRVIQGHDDPNIDLPIALTQAPLAAALKREYPEIVDATCYNRGYGGLVKSGRRIFKEETFNFVDESFFSIFSFAFKKGSPRTALSDPHSIVITEKIARKYFDNADPLGKTLQIRNRIDVKITGIIRDQSHSHIPVDFVLPLSLLKALGTDIDTWGRSNYTTYVLLSENTLPADLSQKIAGFYKQIEPETTNRPLLQPLKEVYLKSNFAYDFMAPPYDIRIIYLLLAIAIFILILACLNFMNLATAQSEKRVKEIALRKTIGAKRRQLMQQFLGEAILLSLLALAFAIVLTEIFVPPFNRFLMGRELALFHPQNAGTYLMLIGGSIFTGIVSGIYPAVFLSSFQPVKIFKGLMISPYRGILTRKILVIVQFAISIIFIIATLTLFSQLEFMLNKDLGYDEQNLIAVPMSPKVQQKLTALKRKLLQHSHITHVTSMLNMPTWVQPSLTLHDWEDNSSGKTLTIFHGSVDRDFIETLQMKMVQGVSFTHASALGLIVNEEAVRQMGIKDPIGKRIKTGKHDGPIIGVVKDFHYNRLSHKIEPFVLKVAPEETRFLIIRVKPDAAEATLQFIEKEWHSFESDYPFKHHLFDDVLGRMYLVERKILELFSYATGLAILISCLGLFGSAAYMTEQRTKEIGIRKSLGASVSDIIRMLSIEFLKLVLIANLIAWPIVYLALDRWLDKFEYRIEISVNVFIFAALLALIISALTVGFKAYKPTRTNPVEALRYE